MYVPKKSIGCYATTESTMTRSRDLAPVQEGIVDGNINSGTYGSRMKGIKGFGCAHASEVGLNTLEVASSDGYYDSDYKDGGSP